MNMSEVEFIGKLAETIDKLHRSAIPLSVDLWDTAMVAGYFKLDPQVVRQTIACRVLVPLR